MGRGRRRGRYRLSRRELGSIAPSVVEAIAGGGGRPVLWSDLKVDCDWPAVAATLEALRQQGLIEYVGADGAVGRGHGFLLTRQGRDWLALEREVRAGRPTTQVRGRLSLLAEG